MSPGLGEEDEIEAEFLGEGGVGARGEVQAVRTRSLLLKLENSRVVQKTRECKHVANTR